jgi:tetratricopeptide (TPR) repeat protein
MKLSDLEPREWRRVEAIATRLLDAREEEREEILTDECGGDTTLRAMALQLLRDFSETSGLMGCAAPLAGKAGALREAGERIGPYRVLRELGHGGMGAVYLAERVDGAFEKQVALKTIPRYGAAGRFQQERQILARLEHPGIARLLDGGTTGDGVPYLVMEYVDGVEVSEYAKGRGEGEVLRLFLQVCGAIRYAHQNLIVHRDLKPANILVTWAGEAKVLDFGIAKLLEEGDGGMTQAMMTPAWASPEQKAGAPANTLSDIYSLGLILKRLLGEELRGDVASIVLKALEVEPGRRYSTVEQFAGDVERYLAGLPVEARQGTWRYRAGKFVRRNKGGVAAGLAILGVMGLGAGGTLSQKYLAERRLADASGLARNVIFDYQVELGKLGGATALRARIARDTVVYLDRMAQDAGGNETLLMDTAVAYRKVAEVQGYSRMANLGDLTGGVENLGKAEGILRRIPRGRVELGWTLSRKGNLLSSIGKNDDAKRATEEAIGILTGLAGDEARAALGWAWQEYSLVENRRGQIQHSIEAARRAVEVSDGLPAAYRDDKGSALVRLSITMAAGAGMSDEAMALTERALALYGEGGKVCGMETGCRLEYLAAREVLGRLLYYQRKVVAALAVYEGVERESAALLERDGNDQMTLRQLRQAQSRVALALQALGRVAEAIERYRATAATSVRIAETDPQNAEGVCMAIYGKAKVGEMLVVHTERTEEAEVALREAVALSDRVGANSSLQCLDQRKLAQINLARVAEKKGARAAGMEWRREAVRTARRYVEKSRGETLGKIIEAGALLELGVGGVESARRGEGRYLGEAREALELALAIYGELEKRGWPLRFQYDGWPERARKLLAEALGKS